AEDGIRDRNVTGVQTCALPILRASSAAPWLRLPARSDAPPGLVYSVACREKPGSRSHRHPSRRHLGCQAQPSSPSSYSCRGTKEGIALRFDRRIDEGQSPKARVNPPLSTARPFTTHRSTDDPSRAPFIGG